MSPTHSRRTQHQSAHSLVKDMTWYLQCVLYIVLCLLANFMLSEGQRYEAIVHYVFCIPLTIVLLRMSTLFVATCLKQNAAISGAPTYLRYAIVPIFYAASCCMATLTISDAPTLLYTWFPGIPLMASATAAFAFVYTSNPTPTSNIASHGSLQPLNRRKRRKQDKEARNQEKDKVNSTGIYKCKR